MQTLVMILIALSMLFIASCSSDKGTNPVDKDKYETVTIGNQVWMQKNLNVSHYRNGEKIFYAESAQDWRNAYENGIGACCYYNNDSINGEIYGMLYNWYAVNDPRGLAPEGWRIPSDDDWIELVNYLGDNPGAKLAGEYDLWFNGALRNHSDFNSSGFSALPGGGRYDSGSFGNKGGFGTWWSSTFVSPSIVNRIIVYTQTIAKRGTSYEWSSNSVRCISE